MKDKLAKFSQIFGGKNNIVIGAIHLPPLLGYADYPGIKVALKNALADLRAFEKGGVHGIIFENNYDIPHKEKVSPGTIAGLMYVGSVLRKKTKLPLGVSVLWNDYESALAIAKTLDLQFIRIPVFIDTVKTNIGIIQGKPEKVIALKQKIAAAKIMLFTDIHVKHSKVISKMNLEESAQAAMSNGSDAIIVTGAWTGQSPDIATLEKLRTRIKKFPLLVGSGFSAQNARTLMRHATGAIVSTALKNGHSKANEQNVKSYNQRISLEKVKQLFTL